MARPAKDDDYTSAAESLLGIDLSSASVPSEPIDLDDADLFGEPDPVPPVKSPEPEPPVASSPPPQAAAIVDDFDDFGAGIDTDDVPPPPRAAAPKPSAPAPAPVRAPAPAPKPARARDSEPEAPPAAEPVREPAPPARKDDSYWDALEGFDWSDDSPASSKPAEREERPRGRSSDRSRRGSGGGERSSERSRQSSSRSSEQPPSRQRPSRPAAQRDDEFGSGLDEAAPSSRRNEPDPDRSIFALDPSESQTRYLDREQATDRSTFPLHPSESQERFVDRGQRSGRPAPPPKSYDDSDDFGAGIDDRADLSSEEDRPDADIRDSSGPASSEGEQRRGRRRGRGRGRGRGDRGRRDDSPATTENRASEVRDVPEEEFDVSFGDFGAAELPAPEPEVSETRFADVPTWAEAISLLVKGRPRTSESNGGGRGDSGGSSERGGGGDRGRGRGRGGRGRGRRPQ